MMKTKSKKKIADALHDIRLSLLDHSACNHLLHFDQNRWKHEALLLVHDLPDLLADRLLSGLEMRFLAVPEPHRDALAEHGYLRVDEINEEIIPLREQPDGMEWASCLGLAAGLDKSWQPHSVEAALIALEHSYSVDLEAEFSASPPIPDQDLAIQSLRFSHELAQCLLDLSLAADSIIKETGTNNLYMAFGFLEWSASDEENTKNPFLAPLLLLPVRLLRNPAHDVDSIHAYTVRASGEDVLCNLPLWEKLRKDFALTLPEPESPFQAQSYFHTLINLITAQQPGWAVRPLIVLSLFRPHEALLYHDLAPERWSVQDGLPKHPLIQSLLAAQTNGRSGEEAKIKAPVPLAEVGSGNVFISLLGKADSDQLRALSLAQAGTSLVIEGAPGTGKSQTIANLIAATLAMNKTVLFVAEKRAALEVVWQRLHQTRLGAFCLELHSDKLEKNRVLQAVRARLEWHGQYRSQEEIDTELALYEREQDKLRGHAATMEQNWRETGKTLRQIFTAATKGRLEIENFTGLELTARDLHPQHLDGDSLSPSRQALLEENIAKYMQIYEHIATQLPSDTSLRQYPWYGIHYSGDDPLRCSQIQQYFAVWQHDLHSLAQGYRQTLERFAVPLLQTTDRLEDIAALQEELSRVPLPQGGELLDMVPKLHGAMLERCKNYHLFFEKILSSFADLARVLPPDVMNNLDAAPGYVKGCENLMRLVVKYHNLNTMSRAVKSLVDLQRELANVQFLMQEIGISMGRGALAYLVTTEEGLTDFRDCILLAAMLPEKCWDKRHLRFDQYELDVFLSRLSDDLRGLHILQEALQDHFALDRLPEKQELRDLHRRLEQGGVLRLLKSSWQEDRKALLELAPNPRNAQFGRMLELLPLAEEMAVKMRELDGNWKYKELLGEHMQGLATDLHSLQALRSWYQAVRGRFGRGSAPKADLGEILLDLPAEALEDLQILSERAIPQKIDAMLSTLAELKKFFPQLAALQSTDMLLHEGKGPIAAFVRSLLAAIHACQPIAMDPCMSISALHELSQKLLRLHEAVFIWEKSDPDNLFFNGRLNLNPRMGSKNSAGLAILRNTLTIAGYLEDESRDPAIRSYLRNHLKSGFARAREAAANLSAALKAERDSFEVFQQTAELDSDLWLRNTNGQVGRILTKNTRALRRIGELQSWLSYVQARNQVIQDGLEWLPPLMEQRKLLPEQALVAYQAGLHDLLEEEILTQLPDLGPFADARRDILQQDMERYALRQKELQFERIASQLDKTQIPTEPRQDVPDDELFELAFLQYACQEGQNSTLSLQQVFRRAGASLQALCPCWLASPVAVARYLEPDALRFDLVIMDEASRIRLANVLGVIARGDQLVVAGDSRQLLPFDDDNDANTEQNMQDSLLSAALAAFPACELNNHYRSRHEALIAFANQRFYDGRLRAVALAAAPSAEEYGIHWHKIERKSHDNEQSHREVAMLIARAIRGHFCSRSGESLGVVVMDAFQRRLVIDSIKSLIEQDEQFRVRLAQDSLRPEPLLLKTMEYIQGDERDVIFIVLSCSASEDHGSEDHGPQDHGSEEHGQGSPSLGRLGSEQGWRYLNVLLTRSRKRMHVFSSLDADDALLANENNRGIRELRRFLLAAAGNRRTGMNGVPIDGQDDGQQIFSCY